MSQDDRDITHYDKPELAAIQPVGGWRIIYHRLYRLSPDAANQVVMDRKGFSVWDVYFVEDLLLIEDESQCLSLDVGWHPHADPDGAFRLTVVRFVRDGKSREAHYDWNNLVVDFTTRSLSEIVDEINKVLARPVQKP